MAAGILSAPYAAVLSQRLGDARENVRRALAGLEDAAKLADGDLRDEVATLHDQLGNWMVNFFNTQYELAARLHDGKIPDATTAYGVAEKLELLLGSERSESAGITNKLGYAKVNLGKAVDLLKEEDAAFAGDAQS